MQFMCSQGLGLWLMQEVAPRLEALVAGPYPQRRSAASGDQYLGPLGPLPPHSPASGSLEGQDHVGKHMVRARGTWQSACSCTVGQQAASCGPWHVYTGSLLPDWHCTIWFPMHVLLQGQGVHAYTIIYQCWTGDDGISFT